jgi:hypothetical protein
MKKKPTMCICIQSIWHKIDGKNTILFKEGEAYQYKDLYLNSYTHYPTRRVYSTKPSWWISYRSTGGNINIVKAPPAFFEYFTISIAAERKLKLKKILRN